MVSTWRIAGGTAAEVMRSDGTATGELPSVAEKLPLMAQAKMQKAAGFWTAIVRPRNFDPRRKYPVIVSVYGGPHATVVHPNADAHVVDQWIADHGYLIVYADGRGTPWRGRTWERAILDGFASVPLDVVRTGVATPGDSYGSRKSASRVTANPPVPFVTIESASSITAPIPRRSMSFMVNTRTPDFLTSWRSSGSTSRIPIITQCSG